MTIIGIKELHRNLKRVADAAQKGASFTVVRGSRPVFRIEPAYVGSDAYASQKVDEIVYGPRKGHTLEDFLTRAKFRTKDKNLSKRVDEIVYGGRR